ncbi:type III secretion system translocon subunit SctE [Belnapia sp. T18]|uniref:Type III secretion system translocon subunit SctE n=1 Tax=Belnapia arida TaxID=2804533 RepID=A0ABS1U5S7_9PROT|nr:type III secretion system translocon subunit SctE [Belnapia arida]MBL6080046.1 type III secretion system translocon subunit SctE [Belnapia arida]
MSGLGPVGGPAPGLVDRTERLGGTDKRQAPPTTSAGAPPPPPASMGGDHIPVLAEPFGMDTTSMMTAFLAIKVKMGDAQQRDTEKDIQADGLARKGHDLDMAKKMGDAIEKQQESEAKSAIMKVFAWIAVALTAIIATAMAVISGGALAAAAAALTVAVAVTMTTLDQTGVMAKLQDAIQQSLVKNGMSEEAAKKWAQGLTMGITIAASLMTLVAGGGGLASAVAETTEEATTLAVKIATVAGKIAVAANAAVTITQAGVGIAAGVDSYNAAQDEADAAEVKKMIAKLQEAMGDETDRLQQMVLQMQDTTTKVMNMIKGQAETAETLLHNMAVPSA